MNCECSETAVIRAQGKPIPTLHSCDYVQARNEIVDRCWKGAWRSVRHREGESDGDHHQRVMLVALKAIEDECREAMKAGRL